MTPVPRRSRDAAPKCPPESVTPGASDTGAPGTGPESRPAGDGPPRAPKPRPGQRPQLQKSLEELFSLPAMAYALNGDEWAMSFINDRAPVMAEAWYKLAQENPAVRRMLNRLTTGGAWGGVLVATGGTVLPLLAHHQVLPAPVQAAFAGVPTTGPSGPIVPPPPAPQSAPPPPPGRRPPEAKQRSGMTSPIAPQEPPGVVTVAGTNNRAVMVD